MRRSIELLVGSCVVYVIVAACSSGGSSIQDAASLGGSNGTSQTTASLGGSTSSSGMLGSSGTMGTSNGSGGTLNGSGGGSVALSGGTKASSSQTSSIIDAGPVPDAMAQTDSGSGGPQVNTVACDTTITSGANTSYYAVMSYPGRSVTELASVHAVGVLVTTTAAGTHSQASAILEEGKARVNCGPTTAKVYSSVIFVLP